MFGHSEAEKLTQKIFLLLIHSIVSYRNKQGRWLSEAGIRHATHYDYITHEVETLKLMSISFKVRNSRNVRSRKMIKSILDYLDSQSTFNLI